MCYKYNKINKCIRVFKICVYAKQKFNIAWRENICPHFNRIVCIDKGYMIKGNIKKKLHS